MKELLKQEALSCVILEDSGALYKSSNTGIDPLLDFLALKKKAVCAADKVIGKSAAMLFVKMGVTEVYGEVMSVHAEKVLKNYGITFSYGTLVPYIINRQKTGMCPMEHTVLEIEDIDLAYQALLQKRKELQSMNIAGLDIVDYCDEGYKAIVHFDTWKVAFLNHSERFDKRNFHDLERHLETDEVFVLLQGAATLLIGAEAKQVEMEPFKMYNIKKGVWHHIWVSEDAKVLIVENENTSKENTEHLKVVE